MRVHSLSGQIQEGVLADILQLVSVNQRTGIFAVEKDGARTELYFRDGSMYHARCGDLEGQSAFFAAMTAEDGVFTFDDTENLPEAKTIDANTQFIILEALRQIDEDRSGN